MKRIRFIVDCITWLFIFLWMYAAASKLMDVEQFQTQVGQSPLLTPFAPFVTWFIPSAEVSIALCLLRDGSRMGGLYASFAMMVMFTVYILAITQLAAYVPCSCGGILQQMSWGQHLKFNLVFVVMAALAILMNSRLIRDILIQQKQDEPKPE